MAIVVNEGIPIPVNSELATTLSDALPKPQITTIFRSLQQEDAWCYAACAEMVINYCLPEQLTTQCEVATFAKAADCTEPVATERGCREDQIGPIFTHFGVDYDGFDPVNPTETGPLELIDILDNLSADPPRPMEAVIEWNGTTTGSSHAVLIIGARGNLVYLIDPLFGSTNGEWQDFDSLVDWFDQGRWVRTWPGLRRKL